MKYRVEFSETALKQFKKLDSFTQQMLVRFIDKHLDGTDNPRRKGKALKGTLKGFWRYETGKYRIICDIEDGICRILVIKIGHRRDVYRG